MRLCLVSRASLLFASLVTGFGPPPGRPAGPAEKLDMFPWRNPFTAPDMAGFQAACTASRTFRAREFLLDDLQTAPPLGLRPYGDALKTFFGGRPYPGSWDGIDPHGYDRNLVLMEYADVPLAVRRWIEAQEVDAGSPGKGLFAVYEKPVDEGYKAKRTVRFAEGGTPEKLRPLDQKRVVLFSPGALYENAPLWVAEGSDCKDALLDVERYSATMRDGGVVAWPTKYTRAKRSEDQREMEFTIEAQVLQAKTSAEKDSKDGHGKDKDNKDEL